MADFLTSVANWTYELFVSTGFDETLGEWGAWLTEASTFLMGMLITLAPILPALLMLYVIDVIWSSIDQGSIQPVGKMLMAIWDMGINVLNAIASTLDAIIPL